MNEQSELQTAIQSALESVKADPHHHLDPRKRIELYTLFGEYNEGKHLGRIAPVRGYLALKTARRVVHLWDEIGHAISTKFGIDQPGYVQDYPLRDLQRTHYFMLMMSEALLIGDLDRKLLDDAVMLLYYHIGNSYRYVEDFIRETAVDTSSVTSFWLAHSALKACQHAVYETKGYGYTKMIPRGCPFRFEIEDTAYFAMRAECGDDAEKRLVFWTWWLTEAIPQAWEQVYGAGY